MCEGPLVVNGSRDLLSVQVNRGCFLSLGVQLGQARPASTKDLMILDAVHAAEVEQVDTRNVVEECNAEAVAKMQ